MPLIGRNRWIARFSAKAAAKYYFSAKADAKTETDFCQERSDNLPGIEIIYVK